MSDPQEKIKLVREAQKSDALDELNEVLEVIQVLEPKERKITKAVFDTYLLGFITGEAKEDANAHATFKRNFFMLAGSYQLGLHVIDKDGKVLYELPPLIADGDNSNSDTSIRYGTLLNAYHNAKDSGAGNGDIILKRGLEAAATTLGVDVNEKREFDLTLRQIYLDYNIIKDVKKESVEEELEDFFDYD